MFAKRGMNSHEKLDPVGNSPISDGLHSREHFLGGYGCRDGSRHESIYSQTVGSKLSLPATAESAAGQRCPEMLSHIKSIIIKITTQEKRGRRLHF